MWTCRKIKGEIQKVALKMYLRVIWSCTMYVLWRYPVGSFPQALHHLCWQLRCCFPSYYFSWLHCQAECGFFPKLFSPSVKLFSWVCQEHLQRRIPMELCLMASDTLYAVLLCYVSVCSGFRDANGKGRLEGQSGACSNCKEGACN